MNTLQQCLICNERCQLEDDTCRGQVQASDQEKHPGFWVHRCDTHKVEEVEEDE